MSNQQDPTVRCAWCTQDELYIQYHDTEWGRPVFDETALFERLVLESMQAGLSWLTVLKKREAMQQQFRQFDIPWLARQGDKQLQRWLTNADLIRHRGKLESMLNNARLVVSCYHQGKTADTFAQWLWSFAPRTHKPRMAGEVPVYTPEAQAMAKALKRQGFRFVGPTTCYAFMQSVGMVNDHHPECMSYQGCLADWQTPLRAA